MRQEEKVISEFAKEIAERISRKTIAALQKVKDIQLGDDSGLKNAWDEICFQVQYEKSFIWDVYDETVRSFVFAYIEELKTYEKSALWFQTDNGWDWLYENEEEHELPPIFGEDIVQYIVREYVYFKAGGWENHRLRAFFEHLRS
ncbi:MAG: hypothetical protein ACWGKN_02545 [Desulfoprunum sp.]|jgi:hypothetical protein